MNKPQPTALSWDAINKMTPQEFADHKKTSETRGGPGRNQGRKKIDRPPSETPRPRPYKLTDAEVVAFAALAASRGITQAELLRRWIATAAPS